MTSQQMALRRVGHYGQPFWRENDPLLILWCPAPNGQVQELLPRSLAAAKSGAPSPEHSRNYVIVTLLRDSTLAPRGRHQTNHRQSNRTHASYRAQRHQTSVALGLPILLRAQLARTNKEPKFLAQVTDP